MIPSGARTCKVARMRDGVEVRLRPGEREQLERAVADRKTPQHHAWRAEIVLLTADGLFRDAPRGKAFAPVAPDTVASVVEKTLRETPATATHWTLRAMAKAAALAPSTVYRIWRQHGLQPHRVETFKLSRGLRQHSRQHL